MTRLTAADHEKITRAVAAAEKKSAGEIVTVVAPRSDAYHDVALHWSIVAVLFALATLAVMPPDLVERAVLGLSGWSAAVTHRPLMLIALVLTTLVFLLANALLAWRPLRMALTPPGTRTRRVRRRAIEYFRIGAERRTVGRTGVLIYLSLAEHRAEIVADAAIHAKVLPETWATIMAAMVAAVADCRPGDGMADAVAAVGDVLALHFPPGEHDRNEIPDRVIEL